MTLTPDDLALLLENFQNSDWTEMNFALDGIRVSLAKGELARALQPPAPARSTAPAPKPTLGRASEVPESHRVHAAGIGVFRRGASPGAEPLVDVGQRVGADDVIGLLEVFRRREEISAGKAGIVAAIHAEDGLVVEYGQLLFTIEPDGRKAAH